MASCLSVALRREVPANGGRSAASLSWGGVPPGLAPPSRHTPWRTCWLRNGGGGGCFNEWLPLGRQKYRQAHSNAFLRDFGTSGGYSGNYHADLVHRLTGTLLHVALSRFMVVCPLRPHGYCQVVSVSVEKRAGHPAYAARRLRDLANHKTNTVPTTLPGGGVPVSRSGEIWGTSVGPYLWNSMLGRRSTTEFKLASCFRAWPSSCLRQSLSSCFGGGFAGVYIGCFFGARPLRGHNDVPFPGGAIEAQRAGHAACFPPPPEKSTFSSSRRKCRSATRPRGFMPCADRVCSDATHKHTIVSQRPSQILTTGSRHVLPFQRLPPTEVRGTKGLASAAQSTRWRCAILLPHEQTSALG